jgi:multisubunit Na+/H+ antiporter MnhG subunit
MNKFLKSNDWQYRLLRTIVQGVLGVIIANIDLITGAFVFDPSTKALVVALVMAVLSPIMALLGGSDSSNIDIPKGEHVKDEGDEASEPSA